MSQSPSAPIPLLSRGKTPTALDTDWMNGLLQAVNAFKAMNFAPQGYGKIVIGQREVTIDMSGLAAVITQIQTAITALQSTGGSGTASLGPIITAINAIIAALNAATVTCNLDGTVTLKIPGIPAPL